MSGLPEGVTRGPWYAHEASDNFWYISNSEDPESAVWNFFGLFHSKDDAEYVCDLVNNHT